MERSQRILSSRLKIGSNTRDNAWSLDSCIMGKVIVWPNISLADIKVATELVGAIDLDGLFIVGPGSGQQNGLSTVL